MLPCIEVAAVLPPPDIIVPYLDLSGEVGPTLFTTTEVASSLTAVGKNDIDIRGAVEAPVEFDWNIEGCQFTALIANRS